MSLRTKIALSLMLAVLSACAVPTTPTPTPEAPEKPAMTLNRVSFDDLPGWKQDKHLQALIAFRQSCAAWHGNGPAKRAGGVTVVAQSWKHACAAALRVADGDSTARQFFERNFIPYAVSDRGDENGLFTGYYAPELRGSLRRHGAYQTPLYGRPHDMIAVDLGAFKTDLKGQRLVGKIDGNTLIPYDDRGDISKGSLTRRAEPLVWVDDPISAFFLEIQGSGHIKLDDGTQMSIGYDGANGRAYVPIGRPMADRGLLQRPVTMPAIRAWLAANPAHAQEMMDMNPSYVFFRRLPNDDVLGAQGIALTAGRSLAVDPAFIPLGVPVWLDSADARGVPLQRLMVAQDTGGAIKGVVRGDVYWGADAAAEAQAGAMQSRGRYYALLPGEPKTADDKE